LRALIRRTLTVTNVAAVGLVLLALVGTGCSRENANPTTVELRYMAWGNPQQLELEKSLCERFNESHPGIRVKFLQVPQSSYLNKMIVMLASRTAPDIMRVDHYNFPSLVKKDYFRPIDDLVAVDKDFKPVDFFPQAIEEGKYKGKFYGVNALFGGILIYYNKTLVKQNGLEDPFELWKRGEWTWERFRLHAIAMSHKGANGRYSSFGTTMPGTVTYAAMVWSFGGEIMNPERTRVVLGEGKARDMFQYWVDLRYKDHACPTPSQSANSAFSFESGKLGMEFNWMGMTPRFRQTATNFEWDVAPMPSGPGGSVNVVKGNQLVMNAETQHPKEAWEFMKFLTSEEVERLICVEMRRAFPTRKAVAYSDEYLKGTLPPYNMRAFTFSVETGRPYPITDRWSDWLGEFSSGIDNLFSGQSLDVDAALKVATKRANDALAIPEGL